MPADHADEHVQDFPSSGSQGICWSGIALSGSFDLPGAPDTSLVPAVSNHWGLGDPTQSTTHLGQLSAALPALALVGLETGDSNLQLVPFWIRGLSTESLALMDRYYQKTKVSVNMTRLLFGWIW